MKGKNNARVFCKKNKSDTLSFYIEVMNQEWYLFSTDYYSNSIYCEYYNGKRVDDTFRKTKKFRQQNIKEHIIRMIKYVESENSMVILNQTRKRNERKSRWNN